MKSIFQRRRTRHRKQGQSAVLAPRNQVRQSRRTLTAPVGATFGNVGRNYLSGPNFFDLDAALSKSIRMTEYFVLDLRMEAFGATNTPQFFFNNTNGTPAGGTAAGTTLGSTSFGQITSASGGRVLQLGAKLTF